MDLDVVDEKCVMQSNMATKFMVIKLILDKPIRGQNDFGQSVELS